MNSQYLCMGCMTTTDEASVCPLCGYQEKGSAVNNDFYLPPRTLLKDRYLIGRILGEGGFGVTYLAYDLILATKLAIKEFLPRGFATRASDGVTVSACGHNTESEARQIFTHGLEKFLDEARILAQFSEHSGIVAVRDFFPANGTGYLVMSYLNGMTLKQHIATQSGRLPFVKAFQLLSPVMDTLREIHTAGLIHRDISPDNIYLTHSQQVKLIDFGAARFAMLENDHSHSLSVIFKRGFAPLEQYYTHGHQGPWTDVYAVAGTLYYAITGQLPPEAPARVHEDRLQPPSMLGVPMPGTTESVLLKGLAVKMKARYTTIEAFQQDLAQAITDEQTQILPSRPAISMITETLISQTDGNSVKQYRPRFLGALGASILALSITALLGIPLYFYFTNPTTKSSPDKDIPPPDVSSAATAPTINQKPIIIQPDISSAATALTINQKPIIIQLDTARGSNPVYHVGERLNLSVQLSEAGYLYCYYRDESGKIARIYPNRYTPNAYLEAGQRIDIPGQNAEFSIEFTTDGEPPEVLCLSSRQELDAKLPTELKMADLEPVDITSIEAVIQNFQALDTSLNHQRLHLTVLNR